MFGTFEFIMQFLTFLIYLRKCKVEETQFPEDYVAYLRHLIYPDFFFILLFSNLSKYTPKENKTIRKRTLQYNLCQL